MRGEFCFCFLQSICRRRRELRQKYFTFFTRDYKISNFKIGIFLRVTANLGIDCVYFFYLVSK